MGLNQNQQVFFELLRAGLWEDIRVKGERLCVNDSSIDLFSSVDWQEVMRIAEEQSVEGLVTAGLKYVSEDRIPQDDLLEFIGMAVQIEQQNRDMNVFLAKLIEKLRKADIDAVLVKGQGIAQCYEKPLWRTCGDIDLLLSDSNYEKAKDILAPLATDVETEYSHFKHQAMTINDWVVELHGTMHSRLSGRVDGMIDDVQEDVFLGGNVRSWNNGGTSVTMPAPDNDVIFVFTHILHHFFFEGIGLKQICDWCRLLWTYRSVIDVGLLEKRLRKMGLMTEWWTLGTFAVDWLGMPAEAMPLYSEDKRRSKKAAKICADVLNVGNFGYNKRRDFSEMSYLQRKFVSVWGRLSDMLRHFSIFPKDSVVFFGGVLRSGLYAAMRGE